MSPADQFRRTLSRLCSDVRFLERVVDPTIADMRREEADAAVTGSRWRRYHARAAGCWALLKCLALYACRPLVSAFAVRSLAALVGMIVLLEFVPLQHLSHAPGGRNVRLIALYLLPQALAAAVPVWFGLVALAAVAGRRNRAPVRAVLLTITLFCSAASFVNINWVTPAANQQFRLLASGRQIPPDGNELTLPALRQQIDWMERTPGWTSTARTLAVLYHVRVAIVFAPLVFACYALLVAGLPRPLVRRTHAALTFALFVICYAGIPPRQAVMATEWLPPSAIGWFANLLVLGAGATTLPLRRLRP
jgi:hypothetical protein